MAKRRHGGVSALGCLLFAGALAWLPSVAAAVSHYWRPDPARPADGGIIHHGTHHYALPPLSAPPPTAGADLPPHFGFPLQPTYHFAAPPVGSEGYPYPFIGSNPTVPLPTGITDTSTVREPPMPDTPAKVAGHAAASVRLDNPVIALAFFFSVLNHLVFCT